MNIKFVSDSGSNDFSKAVTEYETIWQSHGEKMIKAWQDATGFVFVEKEIIVTIFEGPSSAWPAMKLRASYSYDQKKSTFTHELGHVLLYSHKITKKSSLENHKELFLIFIDILRELYGDQFTKETIEYESSLSLVYKEAWDFALSFKTKEERQKKFKEMMAVN